jgi:hypothetical protein
LTLMLDDGLPLRANYLSSRRRKELRDIENFAASNRKHFEPAILIALRERAADSIS